MPNPIKKRQVAKANQMTAGEKAGRKNSKYLAAERAAGTVGKNYAPGQVKKTTGTKSAVGKGQTKVGYKASRDGLRPIGKNPPKKKGR